MSVFQQCETCQYYTYDSYDDEYYCTASLDQDDYAAFDSGKSDCPYYRYYNEYDTVRKQN